VNSFKVKFFKSKFEKFVRVI
jgi:hypothetical protein